MENHQVTPTYQALLILGLDTVAKRLMDGDQQGSWQALKTLFAELPPECQQECRQHLKNHQEALEQISHIQGYTYAETTIRRAAETKRYLNTANLQLFDHFKASLYSKGYLENAPTKPRNPQPTTLGAKQ